MSLSEDLAWRGLIKDKTFDNIKWLDEPKKFYLGIDASDSSLTIGNLAVILLARRLADAGWQAVLLTGGATSLVGDPGGKEEERILQSPEETAKNIEGIKGQMERLFAGKTYELVNNSDWLGGLKYLDFLRDTGKYYPMTELMQREFVGTRMGEGGSGISYAEFSYSLLQGYDFWWLFNNKDVGLQIGASDQWGNMLSGVSLIRKKENKEANALSMPLVIDKTTGRKFGKSEAGAVWLDPERTSPTRFYQFWINVADNDAEEYLKIFTILSREEIEQVMKNQQQNPGSRLAQTRLAEEVTKLVHGEDSDAQAVTVYLTSQVSVGEASSEELDALRNEIPTVKAKVGDEVAQVLLNAGLVSSKREGRDVRASGGVYINGEGVTTEHLHENHFKNGRLMLRRGKAYKDSALVELI